MQRIIRNDLTCLSHFITIFEGIRKYPINPECQAYTYTDEECKVTFCGLNSCHKLDHLCDTGNIAEDALISVGDELNDSYNQGFLNIAIWHHHYYGRPLETNYMDRSILTDLLSNDVHIGLLGISIIFKLLRSILICFYQKTIKYKSFCW